MPAIVGMKGFSYYNENDKFAAQWLRNLIKKGLITDGVVDERSIVDVEPADVGGFRRVHFFAGIAGWDYALDLAGWGDAEVWTGSCPCQPFSAAGKRQGISDERHLWPSMYRLVQACKPKRVFGEQVESAVGHGWLDGVFTDMEAENYACGAAVLGAHSVGAPHIRQRLYWVADAKSERSPLGGQGSVLSQPASSGRLEHATSEQVGIPGQSRQQRDTDIGGLEHPESIGRIERRTESSGRGAIGGCGWSDFDIVHCADGKARRVEAGTFPLAHGATNRVGKLRGYGNAIVPEVAAQFIAACMDGIIV